MTLKHIMLEFKQWFQWTMKDKKARWKFVLCICAIILFLILGTVINGQIMQKQYGNMATMENTTGSPPQSFYETWDWQSGGASSWAKDEQNNQSTGMPSKEHTTTGDSFYGGAAPDTAMMEPTPMMSAIIIAGVFAVAIIVAMALYLRYRRKHMDQIPPLTVLKIKED